MALRWSQAFARKSDKAIVTMTLSLIKAALEEASEQQKAEEVSELEEEVEQLKELEKDAVKASNAESTCSQTFMNSYTCLMT